jgi:2-(1,2-epoxy-1,2-dihydrophenyl)acetyl-CoA isomerase
MLTGAGKAFCAGGDIRTMAGVTPVAGRRRLKNGHRLIRAMVDMEKPIIALVNGVAAGAGVSLTLASDIVFASEDAKFHFSFVNIGLVPDWGEFYFLPMKVGMARAKELMFTGGPIDAADAERIGMINRVLPPARLYEEADAFAQRLAKGPGQAYAMIKCALNRWPAPLETLLELESTMQAVAFASEDFSEGRTAFMEKRKPVYKGR